MATFNGVGTEKIPFLVLPAGDITYLLRDVIPTQWAVSVNANPVEVTTWGDPNPVYIPGLREVSGDISFLSERIEVINSFEDIPTLLDGYSVSDLMRAVNKKLRERAA